MQEIGNLIGKATVLENMAILYHSLKCSQEAITHMEQAIILLKETGTPQDLTGRTVSDLYLLLHAIRIEASETPTPMPTALIEDMIDGIITVMTTKHEHHSSLHKSIAIALQEAQKAGSKRQLDADFFFALLEILDGRSPKFPDDHPYTAAIDTITRGIISGGASTDESFEMNEEAENEENTLYQLLIEKTLEVLGPLTEQKDMWREGLMQIREKATLEEDYEFAALLDTIIGLLDAGGDVAGLGVRLVDPYKQIWQEMVACLSRYRGPTV